MYVLGQEKKQEHFQTLHFCLFVGFCFYSLLHFTPPRIMLQDHGGHSISSAAYFLRYLYSSGMCSVKNMFPCIYTE